MNSNNESKELSIHEQNFYIQDPNDNNIYIKLISDTKIKFIINSYGVIDANYYNELINEYKEYNEKLSNIFIIYKTIFIGHPYEYTYHPSYHKPIKYILKSKKYESDEIQRKYSEIGNKITKEDKNKLTVEAQQLFSDKYIRIKRINLFI